MRNRKMRRQMGSTSQHQRSGQQGNQGNQLQQNKKICEVIDAKFKYETFANLRDLPNEIIQQIVERHYECQVPKKGFDRQLSIKRVEKHIKEIIRDFGRYLDIEAQNELHILGVDYYDSEIDEIDEELANIKFGIFEGIRFGFNEIKVEKDKRTGMILYSGSK